MHLLFRATDARVPGLFRRARFRIANHGETGRAAVARSGIVLTEMETAVSDDERSDGLLSTDREKTEDHARLPGSFDKISKPGRDPYQEPISDPRHRSLVRI